jgi:histidinol-phosphate aminotransferase
MILPKSYIENLRVYEPGKPIEEVARELGFADVLGFNKLASNENELGPSPKAMAAMQSAAAQMHRYPDGGCFYLKQKMADQLGVSPDNLIFGCGSNELIVFLCHVFLDQATNLVMADKSFAVYFLAAALFEAQTLRVPMQDLTHDLDAMLAAITPETRIVAICNPNNPTGTLVSQAAIDRFMEAVPDHVVVVFDEAYIELLPEADQPDVIKYVREGRENVIVLRTFSKAYGLAGLRIGYGVAHPALINLLNKVRQPFNVTAMAQTAALAALDDSAHLERSRETVIAGLNYLETELAQMGVEFVPSVTNFMLVKTGEGRARFEALQKRKVIVRPMDPYGLPEYIRVSIGTAEQNACFIRELKAIL